MADVMDDQESMNVSLDSTLIDLEKNQSNTIRLIDTEVTHRICSGQVVVTLSTAVKELIENSLDAGAKTIQIKLIEYGTKLIEVRDDGEGVEENNFKGLALKNHTSKLKEFEDLASIGTFGFRGEALSSLCALSNLSITTRTKKAKQGFSIDYDSYGIITKKLPIARQIGTTVYLKDLFSTLPVRHKEFLKNSKREFNKMINILQGYSLITSDVRLNCSNETKGSLTQVMCVPPTNSTKERIATIFGIKQLETLVIITEIDKIDEQILNEFGLSSTTFDLSQFNLSGWISKPNAGRPVPDRQFYFINSRPCDSSKMSRVVNEVYRGFSRNKYAFICMNILTKQENLDVNVTPDKRVIYLQNEKILYAKIKACLLSTMKKASAEFSPSLGLCSLSINSNSSTSTSVHNQNNKSTITQIGCVHQEDHLLPSVNLLSEVECEMSTSENLSDCNNIQSHFNKFKFKISDSTLSKETSSLKQVNSALGTKRLLPGGSMKFGNSKKSKSKQPKLFDFVASKGTYSQPKRPRLRSCSPTVLEVGDDDDVQILDILPSSNSAKRYNPTDPKSILSEPNDSDKCDEDEGCVLPTSQSSDTSTNLSTVSSTKIELSSSSECDDTIMEDEVRVIDQTIISRNLRVNWNQLIQKSWENKNKMDAVTGGIGQERIARRFRSRIAPDNNGNAEKELQTELAKETFKYMKLLGQFNLGFIITKLNSDIFIIDQHAADEKYNFEYLGSISVLQEQRLMIPMPLNLPAVAENILMDNLEVFERNGFKFDIKLDADPTNRVKLRKIPYSKSWQFGKSDIEELIFLLQDAPEKSFYRLTKVRDMLASRACRRSVMVGDKLSVRDMTRVITQLGEIDHPWNCPHGRPTLRHLFNLDLLPDVNWYSVNQLREDSRISS